MPPTQQQATPGKKTRRPRTIQACNLCRSKKYKCDGNLPCSHCQKHATECVFQGAEYSSTNGAGYSIGYVKQLERKLEAAESALRSSEPKVILPDHSHLRQSNQHQSPSEHDATGQGRLSSAPSVFLAHNSVDSGCSKGNVPDEMSDACSDEVMDVNMETRRFEYHGQTSSLAFLDRLRKLQEKSAVPSSGALTPQSTGRGRSVVSDFQNESFMSQRRASEALDDEYYPLHAYTFLDTYFKTLHFVHPIIDQSIFLARSYKLWTGQSRRLVQSFKALYFAVLALGALTRTWTESDINGLSRLEWTRLLFQKAERDLGKIGSLNDLEAIQAMFIMAQVCQHELNPNLAYTYIGLAIRTAFSMGINRLAVFRDKDFPQDSPSVVVSRTWWALYSLEIELSFTLGRQDMLGFDVYHNRPPPKIADNENSIITATLGLSRIMREISVGMYEHRKTVAGKLSKAITIERELDEWVSQLPVRIRPFTTSEPPSQTPLRDPYWPKLQMLVLRIRYLHVKTILFYPFFLHVEKFPEGQSPPAELVSAAEKCKDAAICMIKIIHWNFRMHIFYRTWWYNTTYITFGMSVLLSHIAREPYPDRINSIYLEYVEQSLEVLGAMEECKVARKIGDYAREFVTSLRTQVPAPDASQTGQFPPAAQSGVFLDVNTFLSGYVPEFDMGYADFSFFDGSIPDISNGLEEHYGLQGADTYDTHRV